MPTNASDGEIFQVRPVMRLHDQQVMNVLHFRATGGPVIETDLIGALINCITTVLFPGLSADLTLERVDVKKVSAGAAKELEQTLVADNVGEEAGDCLPSHNAAVVTLRTIVPGRSGRGRMYLPGIPESGQAQSKISPELATIIAAFIDCMFTSFKIGDPPATNQFVWGVYSRKLGSPTPPYTSAGFAAITNYRVNTVIGTQRSRKVGRGS